MNIDYPKEWDELPKTERKKKIRELKKQTEKKQKTTSMARNVVVFIAILAVLIVGYRLVTKKTPEEIAFQEEIKEVSLEGKVEELEVEGANHVGAGQTVSYSTNPPTSGSHWTNPADWRFFDKSLPDEQLVHNIEHGGIWISYKGLSSENIDRLKDIAKNNSNSVVVTNRENNDDSIVVVSWGRMMRLDEVDEALIQKYINTYINQSPEKLVS